MLAPSHELLALSHTAIYLTKTGSKFEAVFDDVTSTGPQSLGAGLGAGGASDIVGGDGMYRHAAGNPSRSQPRHSDPGTAPTVGQMMHQSRRPLPPRHSQSAYHVIPCRHVSGGVIDIVGGDGMYRHTAGNPSKSQRRHSDPGTAPTVGYGGYSGTIMYSGSGRY